MKQGHADLMRQCLEECDVVAVRKLWQYVAPEMPQPKNDAQALAMLHIARTQCEIVTFRKRAYSHCWLGDHGLPSQLPDHLRPKAERMYPRTVSAVGIAVSSLSEGMQPVADQVRGAMEEVVSHHYADGITDPAIIKPRMMEAREKTLKKLLGR
jgi:hypothetical protein